MQLMEAATRRCSMLLHTWHTVLCRAWERCCVTLPGGAASLVLRDGDQVREPQSPSRALDVTCSGLLMLTEEGFVPPICQARAWPKGHTCAHVFTAHTGSSGAAATTRLLGVAGLLGAAGYAAGAKSRRGSSGRDAMVQCRLSCVCAYAYQIFVASTGATGARKKCQNQEWSSHAF